MWHKHLAGVTSFSEKSGGGTGQSHGMGQSVRFVLLKGCNTQKPDLAAQQGC